ncbi:MAG TPA: hypothetical protein VH740_09705 [Vicinamibacterales bacterium]|jgi:hypothetical protein
MDISTSHETNLRKAVWGTALRVLVALPVLGLAGCGDLVRQGTGSSYLIVQSLEAASGAEPNEFGGTLNSDVLTFVDGVPSVFNDIGKVRLALAMKDPGGAELPTTPTSANFITVNRYNVRYIRADGRNTPGVDVPSGFDGSFTATVSSSSPEVSFELVRHIAKEQAPLRALARNFAVIISTNAEITFYGRDQTGREVSVMARILINFGDFGDPS